LPEDLSLPSLFLALSRCHVSNLTGSSTPIVNNNLGKRLYFTETPLNGVAKMFVYKEGNNTGIFSTPHPSIKSPSGESDKSVYLF
jgi:hypothetical protein